MNSSLQQIKLERKYQDKIDELAGLVKLKAVELSEIEGRMTEAKSRVGSAEVELQGLNAKIGTAQKELEVLESKMTGAKDEAKAISKNLDSKIAGTQRQVDALEAKKKKLASDLLTTTEALKTAKKDLAWHRIELAKLKKECGNLLRFQNAKKKATDEAKKATEALTVEKKEVADLVKRNGVILTQTVVNLGTIEHYVKRLQRHYSKQGIKIDLYKQFNIKR